METFGGTRMKSNLGFLQVLVLFVFIFNTIGLLHINIFLMLFMILFAWIDSYMLVGGETNTRL